MGHIEEAGFPQKEDAFGSKPGVNFSTLGLSLE